MPRDLYLHSGESICIHLATRTGFAPSRERTLSLHQTGADLVTKPLAYIDEAPSAVSQETLIYFKFHFAFLCVTSPVRAIKKIGSVLTPRERGAAASSIRLEVPRLEV